MPKYIIERDIPGASKFTTEQLKDMSIKSNDIIHKMGSQIQWLHSYVTADKIFSVYIAPNKEFIQDHARQAGFPANAIFQVTSIIDPVTAE